MSSDMGHGDRGAASEAGWRAMYQLVVDGEAHRRLLEAGEATGVPPGVVKALMQLAPGTPLAMKELAERFRCDSSYVTSLVDGLEAAGFAERQPCPGDRRIKMVTLTPQGADALGQVRKILDAPPEWFGVLSDEELAQLRAILGKLQAAQSETA